MDALLPQVEQNGDRQRQHADGLNHAQRCEAQRAGVQHRAATERSQTPEPTGVADELGLVPQAQAATVHRVVHGGVLQPRSHCVPAGP